MGIKAPISKLIVVGGASTNTAILQRYADVLGASVYVISASTNGAALGGCFRAMKGYYGLSNEMLFNLLLNSGSLDLKEVAKARLDRYQMYSNM
jgi:sugar (pentulose or hexulose) kinase